MILRSSDTPPDFDALLPSVKKEFDESPSISDNICSLETDECNVFWTFLPIPVPDDEAKTGAQANLYFPDGESIVGIHKSHVIVVASYGEWGSPLDAVVRASRAAQLFLQSDPDSIAVYWGNGSITNSAEFFDSATTDMSDENLPLMLWVRFQLMQVEDKIKLYTIGMSQFGRMEIETTPASWDPAQMLGFVFNIANYLLVSDAEISDGDTIGGTPEEKINVAYVPSSFYPDRKVCLVQLPS